MSLAIDPARTAVLSMDMQNGIVAACAAGDPEFVPRAADVLRRCRAAGLTVIHIQVGFRPGFPEISPRNPLFQAIRTSEHHQQLFQGNNSAIHSALGPEPDDIVVTKHRVGAFAGTDLEMILRARDIDTLILFGIATSGVVLSTLLDACDSDYRLIALRDCCADHDAEVHACLFDKVFPRRGTVTAAAEFLEALPA
ncbi:MAG: isochorismatase family cysteine hydrolase [Acidobacteriaceae bacterium]